MQSKEERRATVRAWLKDNVIEKEKRRIRDREYKKRNREYLRQKAREYLIENSEKISESRKNRKDQMSAYKKSDRLNNPEKYRARNMINNLIKSGRLDRLPCEKCGDVKSQAHHDDYNYPMEVRWLCRKHHAEAHHKQ